MLFSLPKPEFDLINNNDWRMTDPLWNIFLTEANEYLTDILGITESIGVALIIATVAIFFELAKQTTTIDKEARRILLQELYREHANSIYQQYQAELIKKLNPKKALDCLVDVQQLQDHHTTWLSWATAFFPHPKQDIQTSPITTDAIKPLFNVSNFEITLKDLLDILANTLIKDKKERMEKTSTSFCRYKGSLFKHTPLRTHTRATSLPITPTLSPHI